MIAGLAFVVAAAANVLLYLNACKCLRDEVREHLKSVAATTASQVDAASHAMIRTRADEKGVAYLRTKSVLASVRRANPDVRFIYTMRKSPKPNVWRFVVDAENDPKLMSHVGDSYDVSKLPEMQKSFLGPTADTAPSKDEWGWYISGYAPIVGVRGGAQAIVGVDMSIAQLRRDESGLRRSAIRNTILALLLASLLAVLVTRKACSLINRFVRAAQRVRNGDLEFRVPMSGSEEIAQFATAFNEMIAGLEESRRRLIEGNSRDFLTGLYSHMYLHERLETEIQRSGRYGHPMCLMMIDLDRFKSINDSMGHPVGDSILRQLASVLRSSIRDVDIPVRYGGDEFAAVLPETGKEAALIAAERIRASVEAHQFLAVPLAEWASLSAAEQSGKAMHVTVTIGLACYPEHQGTKDGLIMAADIALCQTKHICRNTVGVYDHGTSGDEMDPSSLYQMLHDPNSVAVASLAAAVDAKDRYTCGHSERVAAYAQEIAEAMHADQGTLDTLRIAGLLHDLGKIGVPDAVLNKPGSLTREERTSIQQHPSLGNNILKRAPHLDQIIPAVLSHHERWDGAGYPNGLTGEQIPMMARIMAVADAFDAMTSDRPYRKAMTVEAALVELRVGAGKQFDPDLVEVFIQKMNTKVAGRAA